jgi:hypothetical protein
MFTNTGEPVTVSSTFISEILVLTGATLSGSREEQAERDWNRDNSNHTNSSDTS